MFCTLELFVVEFLVLERLFFSANTFLPLVDLKQFFFSFCYRKASVVYIVFLELLGI